MKSSVRGDEVRIVLKVKSKFKKIFRERNKEHNWRRSSIIFSQCISNYRRQLETNLNVSYIRIFTYGPVCEKRKLRKGKDSKERMARIARLGRKIRRGKDGEERKERTARKGRRGKDGEVRIAR